MMKHKAKTKDKAERLFHLAEMFIESNLGSWTHEEWEIFVGEVAALGYDMDKTGRQHLGNILEAGKYFYHNGIPLEPETKREAFKPKIVSYGGPAQKVTVSDVLL